MTLLMSDSEDHMQPTQISNDMFTNITSIKVHKRRQVNENVRFRCGEFQFADKLEIAWLKNGDDFRKWSPLSNELIFKNLRFKDTGLYDCVINGQIFVSVDLEIRSETFHETFLIEQKYKSMEESLVLHVLGLALLVLITICVQHVNDFVKRRENFEVKHARGGNVYEFVKENTAWLGHNLEKCRTQNGPSLRELMLEESEASDSSQSIESEENSKSSEASSSVENFEKYSSSDS
jgi:hypothetical protein